MDANWFLSTIVNGAWQDVVAGLAMLARPHTQMPTAPWMWLITVLSLVTGGANVGRRRKYCYR
jgi:hypothetical protein